MVASSLHSESNFNLLQKRFEEYLFLLFEGFRQQHFKVDQDISTPVPPDLLTGPPTS